MGIHHVTSSPGNHRANGAAETAVKTAKRLFKRCKAAGEDPFLGLLNLRNTPTEGTDTSPVQKIFGRGTRSTIPMTSDRLNTTDSMETQVWKEDYVASKVSLMNKNLHDLSILKPGQTVRLQLIANNSKEWKEGVITQQLKSRTYEVESDGKKYRRNRSFVLPSKKSLHDVNTQETVRPVPVPRPRKSLSATTTEVSPPSNRATSDEQLPPPITPRATRSPVKHVTEATRDTRMNNHEAPAESSTNSVMTTMRSGRVNRPLECYEPG